MQTIWHEINVVNGLIFGIPRLISDLDATQPLHPAYALNARDNQTQWITVLGA